MEALIAFLETPLGQELTHAVILVLVAVAAVLTASAHAQAATSSRAIARHLRDHDLVDLADERSTPPSRKDTPFDP